MALLSTKSSNFQSVMIRAAETCGRRRRDEWPKTRDGAQNVAPTRVELRDVPLMCVCMDILPTRRATRLFTCGPGGSRAAVASDGPRGPGAQVSEVKEAACWRAVAILRPLGVVCALWWRLRPATANQVPEQHGRQAGSPQNWWRWPRVSERCTLFFYFAVR